MSYSVVYTSPVCVDLLTCLSHHSCFPFDTSDKYILVRGAYTGTGGVENETASQVA